MQHRDSTSFNKDDLRFENEFKKLKLRAEFGIKLLDSPTDCPLQENEWLNKLEEFEVCHADYNQVPVFVYIGTPDYFPPVEKLSRQQLPKALQELKSLLLENRIKVKTLCKVSDRELYRFILEEVFWKEIPKQREPNHFKTFLYEEFYPNQAYEVKTTIEDFFQYCFQQLWIRADGQLYDRVQSARRSKLKKTDILAKLKNWTSLYEGIQLTDISFEKMQIEKMQATAAACISFEALLPDTYELYHGQLSANFQFRTEDRAIWRMTGIYIPEIGL